MNKNAQSGLYEFDREIARSQKKSIVGVDEAGRGPLAGQVVAAAVILDLADPIRGINDSKKLNEKARESLFTEITSRAISFGIGEASVDEIEQHNILQATFLAMRRALEQISVPWGIALVDGNLRIRDIPADRQEPVIEGDALSASIAAASILAKVTRDRIMKRFHEEYPQYDFIHNKGYATAKHRRSIVEHGLSTIHRRSFCENILSQITLEF